ncbi:Uncharacterised protein [Klebsiella pneumoniae]|nr:Uncharacterised protein [Klebsiella pneumoniae]
MYFEAPTTWCPLRSQDAGAPVWKATSGAHGAFL